MSDKQIPKSVPEQDCEKDAKLTAFALNELSDKEAAQISQETKNLQVANLESLRRLGQEIRFAESVAAGETAATEGNGELKTRINAFFDSKVDNKLDTSCEAGMATSSATPQSVISNEGERKHLWVVVVSLVLLVAFLPLAWQSMLNPTSSPPPVATNDLNLGRLNEDSKTDSYDLLNDSFVSNFGTETRLEELARLQEIDSNKKGAAVVSNGGNLPTVLSGSIPNIDQDPAAIGRLFRTTRSSYGYQSHGSYRANNVFFNQSSGGWRYESSSRRPIVVKFGDIADRSIDGQMQHWRFAYEFDNEAGETYSYSPPNPMTPVTYDTAVSTFAVDVDTASYSNVRRLLNNGQLPPPNAVRLEEFTNYFNYDYRQPKDHPFSVDLKLVEHPWLINACLLRIALQGKSIPPAERPPCNLVFLLDVSGSMKEPGKLALLKEAMKILVNELNENDRVAMVTYSDSAKLHLPPTPGDRVIELRSAIDLLAAEGSTNGSAGIQMAYANARENFVEEGVNRVILATDGDLNLGITDDDELIQLIEEESADGVFLTGLGLGEGNLKDGKMEKLADHGNGVYAYLDSVNEARRVLGDQFGASMQTIAKDVKVQVEFNPQRVSEYRLLGYSNRMLAEKDFEDDAKDAGDIGAGHRVTALYELVPVGEDEPPTPNFATLGKSVARKYQSLDIEPTSGPVCAGSPNEWCTAQLRYKEPQGQESKLLEFTCKSKPQPFEQADESLRFATAASGFALLLNRSPDTGDLTWESVAKIADNAKGVDSNGMRKEMCDLINLSCQLSKPESKPAAVTTEPVTAAETTNGR